ncbi:MAG: sulfatase [Actinomycetota bacterium]
MDAPNIVVILTDDQRADQIREMDALLSEVGDRGATFPRAFVGNPLCCPARASILTGTYSHTNGVWTNGEGTDPSLGGWDVFHDLGHESRTVAVALDEAGYNGALIGKYMNGAQDAPAAPGWDRWVAFAEDRPGYYDYFLRVDPDGQGPQPSALEPHGDAPQDYATDVLAAHAVSFIEDVPESDPLFLLLAPFAPHGRAIPAPRHEGVMDQLHVGLGPAFNEDNVADKPRYIQKRLRLSNDRAAELRADYRTRVETLEAVDEAIADVLAALASTDRLHDTLIVFTSDNGFLFGEHRWTGKLVPYEESVRVPLLVRWDGVIPAGARVRELASHVDIAPTLVEAASTSMPAPVDGYSLLPLLTGAGEAVRSEVLFEHVRFHGGKPDPPSYCGIHTDTDRTYVRYSSGEEEFYNLHHDPAQLRNLAGNRPAGLRDARKRARQNCPYDQIPGFG